MIVNPSEGSTNSEQRVRLMRFHNIYPPELSGYAAPNPYGYYAQPQGYGYYAQPQAYGYYAQPENYGYYGQPEPYGYYAEDPYLSEDLMYGEVDPNYGYYGEVDPAVGYYGQVDPTYGYYAQAPEFAGVGAWDGYGYGESQPAGGEPVGYFAEEQPVGYYGEDPNQTMGYYGQAPEMVGYGEQEFAETDPNVSYYGEPEFGEPEFAGYGGYTRDMPPSFNAGCPLPTNLNGYEGFEGYTSPATVNPTCDTMRSQPGTSPSTPETFKPLW